MFDIKRLFAPFSKPAPRLPAQGGHLVTLHGAVMINTHDGYNIVLTPAFAREIANMLPIAANEAERHLAPLQLAK